ncbi:MAG: hypothetical protein HKL88_07580 [Bacteroidia bacterium]|nr:hypothetical protein [Bacteroidia bacterium]
MLTKNIGFQLGIGDKLSSSTTSTFTNTSSDVSPLPANSSTSTDNYTLTGGSSLQITPAIRLCAGGDGKLQPYSVIGLIIGTSPTATWEDKNTSSSTGNPTNITDEVQTISGGMMLGFHGSIGLLYKVTDQIGISAEIFEDVMNWSPSKSVITTYTDNGVSQLSNMTTSQIETDYGSSATTSSTSSPGSPTQSTNVHFPWSSYGFRISVQYSLGGK